MIILWLRQEAYTIPLYIIVIMLLYNNNINVNINNGHNNPFTETAGRAKEEIRKRTIQLQK